jgi:hypothetical protein
MAGRTIFRQEQVGEDKSRVVRKLSELYRFGRMHNAASIHVMLANFWLFGVLAVKDFAINPPDIWISIKEFLTALKLPQGKNWTGLHVAVLHVFYHMVGDLHGMITPFMDLASTFSYNEDVSKINSRSQPKPMPMLFSMPGPMSCVCVPFLRAGTWANIETFSRL